MEPEENFLTNISEWAELADFFQRCVWIFAISQHYIPYIEEIKG